MADVFLKPKRAQPFYAQHPWVFAGAIERVAPAPPQDGAVVNLRGHTGGFIARGYYNAQSKIQVRLFSWEEATPLDEAFFRARLMQAIALRRDVLMLPTGPGFAYRAVFSEADKLPGLIVDVFGEYAAAQFTSLALAQRKDAIGALLMELLQVRGIYLKNERGMNKLEGLTLTDGVLAGEAPPPEIVLTHGGLHTAVNLQEGQKTGSYLDQLDNHAAVALYAYGARVLDAFCYAGGFGLACAKAGAASVLGVDSSEAALALAQRNAELNALSAVRFLRADVFDQFDVLVAEGAAFDLVILDPPKFARDRHNLPQALRGYRRLLQQAMKLLPGGGVLAMSCCTGLITAEMLQDIIAQCAAEARRDVQLLERRGPRADHPMSLACREGAYLKCLILRVGPAR